MTLRIRTVAGDVAPSSVGRVLPHEHLLCDLSLLSGSLDHVLNDWRLAADELRLAMSAGVTCVVDVTTQDMARDPDGLRKIAAATGAQVVMGTGWYREPYYPPHIDRSSVSDIARAMIAELVNGVPSHDGVAVRAGIIGEIGSHASFVSAQEERVFRAAGVASAATGAPVTTHTGIHPTGTRQADLLLGEGALASRIVVGHADMFLDDDYHDDVLARGVWLQFDTTGRVHLNPDERRADAVIRLVRAGYIDQLLLSSDRCFRSDLTAFGGVGYAHTVTSFRDQLLRRGLTTAEFDQLTRTNPLRMLAWVDPG